MISLLRNTRHTSIVVVGLLLMQRTLPIESRRIATGALSVIFSKILAMFSKSLAEAFSKKGELAKMQKGAPGMLATAGVCMMILVQICRVLMDLVPLLTKRSKAKQLRPQRDPHTKENIYQYVYLMVLLIFLIVRLVIAVSIFYPFRVSVEYCALHMEIPLLANFFQGLDFCLKVIVEMHTTSPSLLVFYSIAFVTFSETIFLPTRRFSFSMVAKSVARCLLKVVFVMSAVTVLGAAFPGADMLYMLLSGALSQGVLRIFETILPSASDVDPAERAKHRLSSNPRMRYFHRRAARVFYFSLFILCLGMFLWHVSILNIRDTPLQS
jgi:hypothetical protein